MALKNLLTQKQPVYFSDFDFSFKPHPKTGDIQILKNEDAVKRSVKTLVLTKYRGRRFYSNKGCNVFSRLFEPLDYITASSIKTDIEVALNNFATRIEVKNIVVEENNEYNGYNITIYFSLINNTKTEEVNIFLNRLM